MAMESNIIGALSGTGADVNASRQLKVVQETDAAANAGNVGCVRQFSENDAGSVTGVPRIVSGEADIDYRQRVSQDLLLDDHIFNYTAQDTGKHLSAAGTIASTWTVGNFTTNSGNTAAPAAGSFAGIATYAAFPNNGTQTLSADVTAAFSAQPQTNTFIEFGFAGASYVPSATAPTDGVFARLSSAGLFLVSVNAGTETPQAVPLSGGTGKWVYTEDKKYQYILYMGGVVAQLWVNDGTGAVLLANIPLPSAQGRIASGQGMRFFFNQRVAGGAAGGAIQGKLGAYNVRLGGSNLTSTISTQGNRIFGSYQGASGGTMGSLATYVNSTNPTAAAPSNTALTANLPGGLGGQGAVIAAVAAATDGIWSSYQVPAATVSIPGRRLVLRGVRLDAVNLGAAVATTATTIQFSIACGHTAVSLATAEGAASKAPRRIALGFMTWAVGAAIGAGPQAGPVFLDLGDAPLFVNPGEHLALVGKFLVGTATASQVINFTYTPIYGWE
jgi:hypothetical protein